MDLEIKNQLFIVGGATSGAVDVGRIGMGVAACAKSHASKATVKVNMETNAYERE